MDGNTRNSCDAVIKGPKRASYGPCVSYSRYFCGVDPRSTPAIRGAHGDGNPATTATATTTFRSRHLNEKDFRKLHGSPTPAWRPERTNSADRTFSIDTNLKIKATQKEYSRRHGGPSSCSRFGTKDSGQRPRILSPSIDLRREAEPDHARPENAVGPVVTSAKLIRENETSDRIVVINSFMQFFG